MTDASSRAPAASPARRSWWALAVSAVLASSCSSACATLPAGTAGADADALAHKVEAWVNKDAWDKTGAIRFHFMEKQALVWDKARGMVDIMDGDVDTQLDLWDRGGFAQKNGVELEGADKQAALDKAWKMFCNDTFWLNPLVKLFDDGVTREIVTMDGKRALKVTYGSGGVTPGDAYVWFVDDDGKPTAVRMWVSVLPVKGISFAWDGWQTLSTGAKVAVEHGAVAMHETAGAVDAKALGVDELFAKLVKRRAPPA